MPHDKGYKRIFSIKKNFLDFIKKYIAFDWMMELTEKDLELIDTIFPCFLPCAFSFISSLSNELHICFTSPFLTVWKLCCGFWICAGFNQESGHSTNQTEQYALFYLFVRDLSYRISAAWHFYSTQYSISKSFLLKPSYHRQHKSDRAIRLWTTSFLQTKSGHGKNGQRTCRSCYSVAVIYTRSRNGIVKSL